MRCDQQAEGRGGGKGGFIVLEDEQPLVTAMGFMRDWRIEQSSVV